MATKSLYRDTDNQMIGGVAAGLAEYFELDISLIRLVTLILVLFTGVGLIVYLIAWIVVPAKPGKKQEKKIEEEIKEKAESVAQTIKTGVKQSGSLSSREFWGVLILIIGLLLIVQNLLGFNFWKNFWPLALILVGLYLILKANDK